jgi:hypothetical protein
MPDAHGDSATYRQHVDWTARKATALRRHKLDCGHPNLGEVFYHAWCDRLSCSDECANGEHDCSAFAGVKSSSEEEEPEPAEAATPAVAWTTNHDPRSIGCRNCGSWLPQRVALCGPCGELPSCAATRWAAVWDGTAVCFLPVGHSRDHESVEGRTWADRVYAVPAAESPVEALRSAFGVLAGAAPALGEAIAATLARGLLPAAPHVDESFALRRRSPEERSAYLTQERERLVAQNVSPDFLAAFDQLAADNQALAELEAAESRLSAWWRRLFLGRSTR